MGWTVEEVAICKQLLLGLRGEQVSDKYRGYIGRLGSLEEEKKILKLHEDPADQPV